jgi:hypothetical protein
MAAMLMAATAFVGYRSGLERRAIIWAAGAAAAVLAPLVVWFMLHPSIYADTFGRWVLHPAHMRNPADWARSLTNWNGLTVVTQVAWDFFNPATLFLSHGTPALPAMFLLPTVVLLGAGLSEVARHRQTPPAHPIFLVACYGCPLVVLAAATFKEPDLTHRALAVTVFAALIAGLGAEAMLQRASTPGRLTVAAVSVAAAIQFGVWQVSR